MGTPEPLSPAALGSALLVFLCACSGPPQWNGSVQTMNGVEIVRNTAQPLLADAEGLVSLLWQMQGSDWIDPSRVHAASGLVVVVDLPANQLHRVSGSGDPLPSVGRRGGGPGEFLHLVDAFQVGSRIAALDAGKGTVEYLDLEGAFLSATFLDGQPWNGFPLADGTLLAKGEFLSDPAQETMGDWVRVEEGREPEAFTTEPLAPLPEEEGVACSDLSGWGDGAARFRFTTPQVQVFDASGALVRQVFVALPVEEVPAAERDAALAELERNLAGHGLPAPFVQQNLAVMEERWRVKCRFGPLRYDASRDLAAFLEQNPEDFGSGNATLHFLSGTGVYLARVAFPKPWEDFAMDDGVVYALTRDPVTDVNTLEAFRVELPESLLSEATRVLEEAGPEEPSLPAPPVVRDSAGITVVENVEPQWAPGSEWTLGQLVTSIGKARGDPAHELYRVSDATRQSDGTVAVGNSSTGEIRLFDQDGAFSRKAGSVGGGPGEFQANGLRTVRHLAGDTLFTWDLLGRRASVFAPDGEFVRSFNLDGPTQQHFFGGVFADGSLLMYVFEYGENPTAENLQEGVVRTPMTLRRYGVDHRLASSIPDVRGSERFQARWGPYGMISTEAPFGRVTSISVGGTRTYVSTGDSDEISVFDKTGGLEMLIRRRLDPTPVTPAIADRDKQRRIDEERGQMEEVNVEPRVIRMIEELPYPDFLPAYRSTVLDSEMNLWAEEFPIVADQPAVWSVFDPDGVWLGRVTLPGGLEIYEIGSDYVLGRVTDEMDVERVLVYELVKDLA